MRFSLPFAPKAHKINIRINLYFYTCILSTLEAASYIYNLPKDKLLFCTPKHKEKKKKSFILVLFHDVPDPVRICTSCFVSAFSYPKNLPQQKVIEPTLMQSPSTQKNP